MLEIGIASYQGFFVTSGTFRGLRASFVPRNDSKKEIVLLSPFGFAPRSFRSGLVFFVKQQIGEV